MTRAEAGARGWPALKVRREDSPGVRAGKWAARWRLQGAILALESALRCVAADRASGMYESAEHSVEAAWAAGESSQFHARALLWRREAAHRERVGAAVHAAASAVYFIDDSDYRQALLGVVRALSPQHEWAIYNGTIGTLLFPEGGDDE